MEKVVSVVILNWNGRQLLEQFLPSVCANTNSGYAEVVVADNGSTDDSVDYVTQNYPGVKMIRLEQNYGFAGGYNRALEKIDTPFAVLLNSDVEVTPGWLDSLVEYALNHPEMGACQPKIRAYRERDKFEYAGASGGFIDRYGYAFCRGRIFDTVEIDGGQYDDVIEIFWATGACLFVRMDSYHAAGGLDEDFFAHMEEIDLCWRIHLLGKRIVVIPSSVVYHLGGATLSVANPQKIYLNFRNNLFLLYKNLPVSAGRKVLFFRRLLDTVALLRFLLTGQMAGVKAIWRAHCDFRKDHNRYRGTQPSVNLLRTFPEGRRNVLFDYFLRGKKTF